MYSRRMQYQPMGFVSPWASSAHGCRAPTSNTCVLADLLHEGARSLSPLSLGTRGLTKPSSLFLGTQRAPSEPLLRQMSAPSRFGRICGSGATPAASQYQCPLSPFSVPPTHNTYTDLHSQPHQSHMHAHGFDGLLCLHTSERWTAHVFFTAHNKPRGALMSLKHE